MHEPWLHPQSPKRGGTQFVSRIRWAALQDAITGPDIVQQIVAIWMNDLVTKGLGNRERAAVDNRTGRRGHDRRHVARGTANSPKDHLPSFGGRG